MPNFDLPAITADASPDFTDARTCVEWLRTLPLVNVAPAHGTLLNQLEELNSFELAAAERLKILEVLREPAFFLQVENAKKFSGRALPLPRQEREIFNNVIALWDALANGYQHCLQAIASGGNVLSGQTALACQRALDCVARKMSEHHKAYQEIAGDDWRLLHKLYRFAEERGVDDSEVADPLCKSRDLTTCAQIWVSAMLLNTANPNEQTPRQVGMITLWLERWAAKVPVSAQPKESSLPPLAVDLDSEHCARHETLSGAAVRYIGLDELGHSLKKRVLLLRKGESPASLKLGDDCVQPSCEQLLLLLYRQWCEGKNAREQQRRSVAGNAQAISGIPAIHYYVSDQPFRQPGQATELSKKQREEIATFGRISTRDEDVYGSQQGYAIEDWQILDESLTGLRLRRPAGNLGARLAHTQLMAIRPVESKNFLLGTVRWMSSSQNFDLNSGIRVIPGLPQAVAVKSTGLNSATEKYVQALALAAIPALQAPASLMLPTGWFKPKRVIELWREASEQVLLTGLLERGVDFERVSYEPA